MPDINLLPEEERSAEGFENLRKKLLLGSVAALVITGVLTMVVLFYFAALNAQKDKLVERVEASSGEIESMKAQEELIVVTKDKASSAEKILSSRTNMSEFFTKFGQLVPQNLFFSDLRIGGSKFTASGRAKTSNDVAGFVSALVSAKGTDLVSNISIDSLSSDENGNYSFVVNMSLVSKPVQQTTDGGMQP